jgi:hypothetical protein
VARWAEAKLIMAFGVGAAIQRWAALAIALELVPFSDFFRSFMMGSSSPFATTPLFSHSDTFPRSRPFLRILPKRFFYCAVVARRAETRARSPESTDRTAWINARHPRKFKGRSLRSACLRDRAKRVDFLVFAEAV